MTASSRRRFIICLDTALLIIFILLLSPRLTGLPVHELLGFVFFIPIIIHLLLAWPWIQNATAKFFSKASARTRINFFLNIILFVLAVTAIVSGYFISQVVVPGLGIKKINDRAWRSVHNLPFNLIAIIAGIHIAMNWSWIVSVFKKRVNISKQNNTLLSPKMLTMIMRSFIIVLSSGIVAVMLYSIVGKPALERIYKQNDIIRFTPTLGHGLLQFFGEAFLIAVYAFVARKWLRIRL